MVKAPLGSPIWIIYIYLPCFGMFARFTCLGSFSRLLSLFIRLDAMVVNIMDFGTDSGVGISRLPDHILCHILSFLQINLHVLSTRWKHLWTSIPVVDIDARQHGEFYRILNINVNRGSEVTFQSFVSRVLLLNGTPHIQKLRLIYDCCNNTGTIRTWFKVAITHNIQELELDLFSSVRREFGKLPRKLFTSNSLVVLKLSRMPLCAPSLVCLLRLKILELRRMTYSDDNGIQNLLAGCLVLEDLVIEETAREKPSVLHFLNYRFEIDVMVNSSYKFVINAPNLKYLHIKGRISDDFAVKSLATAISVHLDRRRTGVLPEEYFFCCEHPFLRGISNVKFPALSSDIVQLLCAVPEHNLPRFINLANLAFGVGFDFCWIRLVMEFIKCSENLEVLTLNNKGLLRDVDELHKTPPQPVPECLVYHLRGILIKELYAGFTPDTVEYMVQEVNILKRPEVNCQCPIMLRPPIDYTL
ncbi:LOW QUALITY PROTEIN: hypothetical protein Cgig2_013271 [Carnegiea gigantea]|uniref:F-box/LRR-repeat protein 15/At3g58940/PEG3-like LRR domain-containing protein n=1 Tax=Carnegiea gigantea TaxID=171969 RepID=A0A9Q1K3N8_9CARY|nr:LOW QUALITY PROTEIN: hypothetical protein Cgig2_013271 [Carnegiea gigantea]